MIKEVNCCLLGLGSLFPTSQSGEGEGEVKCSRSSVCGNVGCWKAPWSPLSGASARLCSTLSLRVVIRLLQWSDTLLSLFFFILQVELFALYAAWQNEGQKGKKHYGVNTLREHRASAEGITSPGIHQGDRTSNSRETHNETHSTAHCVPITVKLLRQTQEPTTPWG